MPGFILGQVVLVGWAMAFLQIAVLTGFEGVYKGKDNQVMGVNCKIFL